MRLAGRSAAQLTKWLRKFHGRDVRTIAQHLAGRIEGGPRLSCTPKKKLRAEGFLPPVGMLLKVHKPARPEDYKGHYVSDGETCLLVGDPLPDYCTYQNQGINNERRNKWWGTAWNDPEGRKFIIVPGEAQYLTWFKIVCESDLVKGKC